MIGIIWYRDNAQAGIDMLKQVILDYARADIEPSYSNSHFSKNFAWVTFKNGDKWSIAGARNSSRGIACNIAYVERSIDYDTYRTIIFPTIKCKPYTAIHLWGEGNLHLDDSQPLPF